MTDLDPGTLRDTGVSAVAQSRPSLVSPPPGSPWAVVEEVVLDFRPRRADGVALAAHVCAETVRLIGPAEHAGILLGGDRRHPDVVAGAGEVPLHLAEVQQQAGRGPCLLAARTRSVVRIDDTATETRWPTVTDAARAAGVATMLCLPLRVDDAVWGTLTVHAGLPHSLTDAEPAVRVLGLLAALAVAEQRQMTNLRTALDSRDLIGQAKGVIMAQHHVDAETAFTLLSTQSQLTNVKLVEVTAHVVQTGAFNPS